MQKSPNNNAMDRYRQQILLPEFGTEGQAILNSASVLVVGAGGLGSPAALYLSAAGIGRIVLVDPDTVAISNLHRQILYGEDDIGSAKVEKAARTLYGFRSDVKIETHTCWLTEENAAQLVGSVNVVLDCTDNFSSRYLLNRICRRLRIPLVYASVSAWEGQITSFAFDCDDVPCLECLFPAGDDAVPNCSITGTIGVVPGILGLWQVNEALHILLGRERLTGRLLLIDLLHHEMREFRYERSTGCRCSFSEDATEEVAGFIRRLTASEYLNSAEEWFVVDVRPVGGLKGAIHIPLESLAERWHECHSDRPTLFVCTAGIRSLQAARLLAEKGQTAYTLNGGLIALKEAVHMHAGASTTFSFD